MRLKGGSLFYALAISVVIGFMLSGLILTFCCHQLLLKQDGLEVELRRNAESGFYLACSDSSVNDECVDLFGRGKDSVHVTRRRWGVYDVITSTAYSGNSEFTRIGMTGNTPAESPFALWLADMDRPLFMSGNSRLNGTCYLPASGVQRGYIEGRSFSGRELVDGDVLRSSRFIPALNSTRLDALKKRMTLQDTGSDSLCAWSELENAGTFNRSFSSSTVYITTAGQMVIDNVSFNGNIIFMSRSSIVVGPNAHLTNVILIAPVIRILDGITGVFQACATDSIIVGENVQLNYPSALCVVTHSASTRDPRITLNEGTHVSGSLLLSNGDESIARVPCIEFSKGSVLEGEVYCTGSIELQGEILGSVTCERFVLHTNSAVYENYLLDAAIDITRRDVHWLGPALINNNTCSDVIQWLD